MGPMRSFMLACCLVGMGCLTTAVRDSERHRHGTIFRNFVQQHGRTYENGSLEYNTRFELFSKTLNEVETHNRRTDRLWTAGINHLSDRSEAELAELRGWRGGAARESNAEVLATKSSFLESTLLAKDFSWDHLKTFQQVRDQASCGSCWAVATSTMLQAHSEIHQQPNSRTFSEQELVDCVPNPHECGGKGKCSGATVELALKYVAQHGLATEEEWPYEAKDGECRADRRGEQSMLSTREMEDGDDANDDMSNPGIHDVNPTWPGWALGVKAWERLPQNDYVGLISALVQRGPVAVSAAANGWSNYESGVFTSKSKVVDHAVVLLGYGELPVINDEQMPTQYWLIQNSWTSRWGEHGRIRLHRKDSDSHNCGEDQQPELGTGCKNGPRTVTVCGECGILYDSVVPHFHIAGELSGSGS